MNHPKVSVIVPCYNQAQYLDEALQSVLDQTYSNWECIIVNDGSPDHTAKVATKWVQRDARFIYFYKENGGVSSARNAGISIAEGEFILPLDADDKIANKYIELAVQSFQEDDSLKVVYCRAEKFGDEVGIWNLQPYSVRALAVGNMIFCSALFRKQNWRVVGGYDINMVQGIEDWEFWISILKNGGSVKCLDVLGFYYRIRKESRQKVFNAVGGQYLLEYMSIKHADFFAKQFGNSIQLYKEYLELKKFHHKVVSSFFYKIYKSTKSMFK